jgi:NADPH-dependent 2,4-dienoyl-CoA reductase/sulfur reductase-like enzyme
LGKEKDLPIMPTTKPKRVMVIGGGPAGLEAARSAAIRGHQVTLYEKSNKVGGQWRLAAVPPNKTHFLGVIGYLERQLKKIGVKIELGKSVTSSTVEQEKPDALIIATGARPLLPDLKEIELEKVKTAWDVLTGDLQPAKRVLVVGGNSVGLEAANYLAHMGSQVTVTEMGPYFGADMGRTLRYYLKQELRNKPNVELSKETKVEEIIPEGVIVARDGNREVWKGFDMVVWATGSVSTDSLTEKARHIVSEVHIIGDATEPRDGVAAIREGTEVGRRL